VNKAIKEKIRSASEHSSGNLESADAKLSSIASYEPPFPAKLVAASSAPFVDGCAALTAVASLSQRY
jgi:hypothetical protein